MEFSAINNYNGSLMFCQNASCTSDKKISDIKKHNEFEGIIQLKCSICNSQFYLCIYCLNQYGALRSQINYESRVKLHCNNKFHTKMVEKHKSKSQSPKNISQIADLTKAIGKQRSSIECSLNEKKSCQSSFSTISSLSSSFRSKSPTDFFKESSNFEREAS